MPEPVYQRVQRLFEMVLRHGDNFTIRGAGVAPGVYLSWEMLAEMSGPRIVEKRRGRDLLEVN
ncbi:MAG: hypothetical protein M3N10_05135 [Actinomycetota bacterium]|nr:hypothetical protein [Actinomycetota bacterium]